VNQWLRVFAVESARRIPQKRRFALLLMVFEVRTASPTYDAVKACLIIYITGWSKKISESRKEAVEGRHSPRSQLS
jgi:hypothetical protein